nr:PREDICTED: TMV resistance protein N-like isoform X2 [Daucus carota subsp. sativus]
MPKHESVDSSSDKYKYDVFLSFRGEDTRKTFTDHLYTAIVNEGLIVFRDNEEIERGETIKSELEEGIQESRSWVVVFSEKYAFSSWCLDELVMILQCKNNSNRLLLPIFYHGHPSDIRKQSGFVSQAFYMHEQKFKSEVDDTRRKDMMDKIKGWRTALAEVANLAGMTFPNGTNGQEAEFIKDIVKCISDKVAFNILSITPHLVGINASAEAINSWIRNGSNDVEVFALYGIGGVGKTTIAKYVYNTNFQLFEGGSFLENIREYSERVDGLVCLQRQLLADISKGNTPTINNLNDGIRKIQRAVCLRKLLIVLDDVDQVEQLDAIFGMRECFHPGSKIILTTRDVDLLKAREPCTRHVVETLNLRDSSELFSRHAFRDSCPPEYYMEDSQRILKQCEGLPLALEVLGAYLRDKKADVWRSAVEKLEVIPHHKIQKILQLSYESLEDDYDNNLFLDIACFFNEEAKSRVVMILDECKYHTRIGIEKLIDRCLLKIDIFEKLRMHCLIQSMGREIIRQESPKEPGERSRLWHHKDSLEVLEDETGTRAIEGLALELNRTDVCQVELRTSGFSRMHKLRLLKLDNVRLNGGYEKKLEWLCWHRCPLKALPKGFPSTSLVAIEMQRSKLQKMCHGSMLFKSLKFLDLSHSHDLVKSPNFAELIALKQLILEDCVSLGEIDESIGMAAGLVLLNLKDCELLKTLPKNMGMLKSLELLIISGCSNLNKLPIEMINMESLKSFHADGVNFGNSIARAQEYKSWLNFIWDWVSTPRRGLQLSLTYLPSKSITKLSLVNCNLHDDDFPKDFGHSVECLDLSKNPISFLPDCFKGLKRLKKLQTEHCQQLQALEDIPYMLEKIYAGECPLLEKITFNGPFKFYACHVTALSCQKLIEMGSLYKMVPIGEIDSKFINSCGIFDPEGMKKMQMRLWNKMTGERSCPIQGAVYRQGS